MKKAFLGYIARPNGPKMPGDEGKTVSFQDMALPKDMYSQWSAS